MKKWLLLAVIFAMFVTVLVSCGKTENSSTTAKPIDETTTKGPQATSENETTESSTEEVTTEPYTLQSISINGTDISKYTIVYAKSPLEEQKNNITTEYDFDKISAEKLQKLIKSYLGIELPIAKDTEKAESQYEILVGKTTRKISGGTNLTKLQTYDYVIEAVGDKLLVCGGVYGVTYHSIDYLKQYIDSEIAKRNENINIAGGYKKTGTHKLTTVACVGDSITQGVGASSSIHSYPSVLQRVLWKDYVVINYGNSGKTLRTDLLSSGGSKESYQLTNEFKSCKDNIQNIDIMLIMLGTNDSNRVATVHKREWNETDDTKYLTDYKLLLTIFHKSNKNIHFVIMNCPVYYGNQMFGSERVRNLQQQAYENAQKDGLSVSFYDMYTFSKTKMGTSCFPDSLHPNDKGYDIMGKELARYIKTLEK